MQQHLFTAGTDIEHRGIVLRVRSVDGNVLELEAADGSFSHFAHVSSVKPCTPPAHESQSGSLAVPAEVGQGAGSSSEDRNRAAWMSIADFLTLQNLRAVLAARAAAHAKRSAGAAAGAQSAINFGGCVATVTASGPDGNHGDNFAPASSEVLA